MSIEATADALVADTAMPEAPMTDLPNDEADLSALYDKLHEEAPETDAPTEQPETEEVAEVEAVEEPAEADEPSEVAEKPVEVPSGLPAELREHWAKMPEAAREAVMRDRDGLHRKLSDMGRQVQGIAPIRDELVGMVKEFPQLAHMKPQEVAREMRTLATVGHQLTQDPVATLMRLAKQHGAEQALAQRLAGQDVSTDAKYVTALQREITGLKQQLKQVADPDYLAERVNQITSQQTTLNEVQEFAQSAEHWGEVEEYLPLYIPAVKARLGESAAPKAVLKAAYERAIQDYLPNAKAPKQPADEAQVVTDPERTKAALKAKSVNVSGKSTGKQRALTEEEELSLAFDRAQKK